MSLDIRVAYNNSTDRMILSHSYNSNGDYTYFDSQYTNKTTITVADNLDRLKLNTDYVLNVTLNDIELRGYIALSADDTNVTAGGTDFSTLTITLKDKNGNIVTGNDRQLSVSSEYGILSNKTPTTSSGVITLTIKIWDTATTVVRVSDASGLFRSGSIDITGVA